MRLLVVLACAALGGCYAPEIARCSIQCGDGGACPSGMSCGEDLFCHPPGEALCGPRFVQVSAGGAHTCGVKDDHTLWCWGQGESGQTGQTDARDTGVPGRVGDDADWQQVDASFAHTCGVKLDGSLWCWGDGRASQLASPDLVRFSPVRVGTDQDWAAAYTSSAVHSCGRKRDGTLWCWGDSSRTLVADAEGAYAAASRSHQFGCGVRTDGTLWCWGWNGDGELGDGAPASGEFPPRQVGERSDWVDVGTGSKHACALAGDQSVWCWGNNALGVLGAPTGAAVSAPVQVGAGQSWARLDVGQNATCARDGTGQLWCWGVGATGELGDGAARTSQTPVRVDAAAQWAQVSVGSAHVCAVKANGVAACWGNNDSGQLGLGEVGATREPRDTQQGSDWTSLGLGERHACAIRQGGALYCWGKNDSGQLGDGSTEQQGYPTQVASEERWVEVAAGGASTCAVTDAGALYCWGNNDDGQVGDGSTGPGSEKLTPTRIGDAVGWSSPAVASQSACAIREARLYCWGYLVGATPTVRTGYADWLTTRGWLTTPFAGLRGDGRVTTVSVTADTTILEVSGWTTFARGQAHYCGLREGSVLECTGSNTDGEIGAGFTSVEASFTHAGSWLAVGASTHTSWAVRDDGTLWGWGANRGLLGDGDDASRSTLVQIGVGADWRAIAGGSSSACGLRGDGALWCWGSNSHGQLGSGVGGTTRPFNVVEY